MLAEVLENFPDFKAAWERAEYLVDHYDQGKHYCAHQFLGYKLTEEPITTQKVVGVQFFEANHGKTKSLDARFFGNCGMAKMLETLVKKEEVLETKQFVDHFRKCSSQQRADPNLYKDEKARDLQIDHFWTWLPKEAGPPKRVRRLMCS